MEGIASLLPLILIFVVFYFLVIRRSQRQQQQIRDVQRSIAVGQQIMTTAGLYATVSAVEDDVVILEIAPGVLARYARAAVARVVEPVPVSEATSDSTTGQSTALDGSITTTDVADTPGTIRPDAPRDTRTDRP